MFADSLLETSWAQRSRRSWTTLTSFGLEAVVIAFLLILPILRTVGIPAARIVSTPLTLGHIGEPSTPEHALGRSPTAPVRYFDPNGLMLPSHRHPDFPQGNEPDGMQPPQGLGMGDGTEIGSGGLTGLRLPFVGGNHPVMPSEPPATVRPTFRPSNLLEGSLIRRVQPVYPPLARSARVQGAVVLFAVISQAGTIQNLRLVSGHPMLVPAAIEAVSQWRYRPYILNSEPIEVETQITVNFILGN